MHFSKFLTLATIGSASAAVIAEPALKAVRSEVDLEKRDCDGHSSQDWWTGISDAATGGCAWYYCQEYVIVKWIDCGVVGCAGAPGSPSCAW